ncbi:MAG: hypothetical protein ACLSCO_01540 [Gallintestinimicrobium sp.]
MAYLKHRPRHVRASLFIIRKKKFCALRRASKH